MRNALKMTDQIPLSIFDMIEHQLGHDELGHLGFGVLQL